jgi:predicted amidophosphoribosyltransferase
VTFVPLHPRRLRARGYNQAALLARPLAHALSVPLAPFLLARVRDTAAQVGRGASVRKDQLAQAFRTRGALSQRTCLVVDDVRTTGATLAEARRALLAGGAARVCTLALACVLPEEESRGLAGL